MTVQSKESETFANIITLEQDHLNQFGSAKEFANRFDDILDEAETGPQPVKVSLDFQWINRITSIGLNEIIGINTEARKRNIRIVLSNVPKSVRDIFSLTRLERLFEFDIVRASA